MSYNPSEIVEIRKDLQNLKETIEIFFILLNKKLMKELYREIAQIKNGDYYTKEEFMARHHLKSS